MATELRPFGVASVSMYPGVVATEVMLDMVESGKWAETMPIDPSFFESPELTGLAVAALAALPADKKRAWASPARASRGGGDEARRHDSPNAMHPEWLVSTREVSSGLEKRHVASAHKLCVNLLHAACGCR